MTPATFHAIRTAADMTQADLAAHLGITVRTVRRYESGNRRIPGPVVRCIMALGPRADSTAPVTPVA